jgi:hypothetical protein
VAISVDVLVQELTDLRLGPGLTAQSIMLAPTVLAALGDPTPTEAVEMLVSTVRSLGDSEPALVLRRAFAIDVSPPEVLTTRRRNYHRDTGRDIKTIIRHENKMIRQLAALLVKGGEHGRLMVGLWVKDRAFRYFRAEFDDDLPFEVEIERAYEYELKRESLPIFLYTLPTSYAPSHMVLSVLFQGEQPEEVWGIQTSDILEIATTRYERRIIRQPDDERADWRYLDYDKPQVGHYYGYGWRW